jgi:hypothetical protein
MPEPKPEEVLKILASRYKVVADLVADHEKLKDELAVYKAASASEPLPTEPTVEQTEAPAAPVESADESAASDWAQPAAPQPAEAPKKNAKGRK